MMQSTSRLWIAAVVLGVAGTWMLFDTEVGINWPITAVLIITGLHVVLRGTEVDSLLTSSAWCSPLILLLAGGAALTSNGFFHFWIAVGVATLLALSTLLNAGLRPGAVGPLRATSAPLRASVLVVRESSYRVGAGAREVIRNEQSYRAARGSVLALPILSVFFLLLGSADPTFAAWRDEWIEALRNLSMIPRLLFFTGLTAALLGFYGSALRAPDSRLAQIGVTRRRAILSNVERTIVLGSVAALFALFLALQVSYLFGNPGSRPGSGLSYAEAVHRGFGELTIVVTLCAWLILACDRLAQRCARELHVRLLGLLLVAECALLLASAYHRLAAYEAAYGYTSYRLYVAVYIVAAALSLVALTAELLRGIDLARLTRHVAWIAVLAICTPVYWNSAAWVVRKNIERYASTGNIDVDYLASGISADAIPQIVASLPRLERTVADRLVQQLSTRQQSYVGPNRPSCSRQESETWFEWNLRRNAARRALQTLQDSSPAGTPRSLLQ